MPKLNKTEIPQKIYHPKGLLLNRTYMIFFILANIADIYSNVYINIKLLHIHMLHMHMHMAWEATLIEWAGTEAAL